jgi:hypothetical protein
MNPPIDPELIPSDVAVLKNLLRDIDIDRSQANGHSSSSDKPTNPSRPVYGDEYNDAATTSSLDQLRQEPVIITSKDYDKLNLTNGYRASLLVRYIAWASTVARNPVDVVFVTHIILYLCTSVPSAVFLYYHYTHLHAVLHWIMQASYCGPFTLMLHNHIHNNGLLNQQYAWFDHTWPLILEPLMGHTWHSYYYHHVKHHHVEGNGPEDLSSTIRYQRDELSNFLMYLGRFMFLIWYDLPRYFIRKGMYAYAFKAASLEFLSYAAIAALARWRFTPTLFVLIIPFVQMRIGLMVGNFGQHALVDDIDPTSDFRSSITLIDVNVSNSSVQEHKDPFNSDCSPIATASMMAGIPRITSTLAGTGETIHGLS